MKWFVLAACLISVTAHAQPFAAQPLSPRPLPHGVSIPTIAPSDLVYPGCPVPPTTFPHVWHLDPIAGFAMSDYNNGTNDAPLITAIGGANGQGTSTHPWNSLEAAFTLQTGYPTPLLSTVNGSTGPIQPGDEIVLANGNYGEISGGGLSVPANQIINVPAVTITGSPSSVLSTITLSGVTGFVFNGPTVQSQDTDGIALVVIQDGNNVGYTNSNIVLMNMAVNSAPLATIQGWTQAQFVANARPGVFIQGSNQGAGMNCVSAIGSHISGIHLRGAGALTVIANSVLLLNNEVDHFSAQGIQYNGTGIAVLGNYVHDVYNDGVLADSYDYKGAIQGRSVSHSGSTAEHLHHSQQDH
jgi:hypothetical protein